MTSEPQAVNTPHETAHSPVLPIPPRPRVYTLCGSSRFPQAHALANMHLSLQGHVVIPLGMMGHADEPPGARFLTGDGDERGRTKQRLDQLHFEKIHLSDAIYVVNVGGYVGSSTRREIVYAWSQGKAVEWMFGADPAWVDHHLNLHGDQSRPDCSYCSAAAELRSTFSPFCLPRSTGGAP